MYIITLFKSSNLLGAPEPYSGRLLARRVGQIHRAQRNGNFAVPLPRFSGVERTYPRPPSQWDLPPKAGAIPAAGRLYFGLPYGIFIINFLLKRQFIWDCSPKAGQFRQRDALNFSYLLFDRSAPKKIPDYNN